MTCGILARAPCRAVSAHNSTGFSPARLKGSPLSADNCFVCPGNAENDLDSKLANELDRAVQLREGLLDCYLNAIKNCASYAIES